jgi:hypothetical protein
MENTLVSLHEVMKELLVSDLKNISHVTLFIGQEGMTKMWEILEAKVINRKSRINLRPLKAILRADSLSKMPKTIKGIIASEFITMFKDKISAFLVLLSFITMS